MQLANTGIPTTPKLGIRQIPSLEPLFFLVWVHGLCFLSPFLLWRFFARFGFRWGFFCTRTTCMFAEPGVGGGFHHPPRCAPWVLPVTHSDRTFVLLPPLKTSKHSRFEVQGPLWLAGRAVNCSKGLGAHIWVVLGEQTWAPDHYFFKFLTANIYSC